MGRLRTVLPSLQQLQWLRLNDATSYDHDISYDPVLSGVGALTDLTYLDLAEVCDKQCLSSSIALHICSRAQQQFQHLQDSQASCIALEPAALTVCTTLAQCQWCCVCA
jgi:hypothetical protein